jgi:hypothetical protein
MLHPLLVEEENLVPRAEAQDAGDLAGNRPRERGPPLPDLPRGYGEAMPHPRASARLRRIG